MASGSDLSWETLLKYISKAVPQILEVANDENVKSLFTSAASIAGLLLSSKTVSGEGAVTGAGTVAGLLVAACNVWQLIHCNIENERQKELRNRYAKFASFIDEIRLETNKELAQIKELVDGIAKQVANFNSVKKDELESLVDSVSISVRLIEIRIEGCKKKVAFALEKIKDFISSICDADDRDEMSYFLSGLSTFAISIVFTAMFPLQGLIAGVETSFNLVTNFLNYRGRTDERAELKNDLQLKKANFENMMLDLEICQSTLAELIQMANNFRKYAK